MRRNVNQENIEGRVYDHDLTLKTVQNQKITERIIRIKVKKY